jgi:hypothetical protein
MAMQGTEIKRLDQAATQIPWVAYLNDRVLHRYNTRLNGGFPEPYYKASQAGMPAEVQFTRDYERSALHELGHWCIAGQQRRRMNDYGYWYVPDGRSEAQQLLFYSVEIRPQAVEKHFCVALALPFEVSADNLGNHSRTDRDQFSHRVDEQYQRYRSEGFPPRATEICDCLRQWRRETAWSRVVTDSP